MANEKRDKRLFIRVTEEEKRQIEIKAKKMGLRVSTYLRFLLKRGKIS